MTMAPTDHLPTHRVENQPEFPAERDFWAEDPVLVERARAAGADAELLAALGRLAGRADWQEAARAARRHGPELVAFDRGGRRLDEVRYHPDYHRLMALGLGHGYAAVAWEGRAGGHATHAAIAWIMTRLDPGVCCPMTMTYAAVPALAHAAPDTAASWRPRLLARSYDPTPRPVGEKEAATMGMAMTEKQGGSDVRSNTTRAERDGEGWRLTGHKWFCSAPMSDGFLTLAQAPGGLTCFLVPRWLPDRSRNAIRLMRLKDKLGDRANASAEIEYERAWAEQVGEEGAGVRTIIEMVHHTRLDTAVAPAALMRAALAEAAHWVRHRSAFGRRLADQPLMRQVLADLALDLEGAAALAFRVARAFDGEDTQARAMARIGVALAKYLNNRRCPVVIHEAMEVLGGMGYVEDTPMPMLFRQSPLNGIWEGAGNVICLDILRTLARVPASGDALHAELAAARGEDRRFDAALAAFSDRWRTPPAEAEARLFAEQAATLLSASVLLREAPGAVAHAYCASRLDGLGGRRGLTVGALAAIEADMLLDRL